MYEFKGALKQFGWSPIDQQPKLICFERTEFCALS